MPKSAYHVAVDQIQAAIRPRLGDFGFRVRGRTFNRKTDDGLTQVIDFQMGPFDPPGTLPIPVLRPNLHGLFTVNLGVYIPEVSLVRGREAKAWVREYHCEIRARLAAVSRETRNAWWPAEASPAVIESVRECIDVGGVRWLERFSTRHQILNELDDPASKRWCLPRRIVMAIILVARGDAEGARSLLLDQLSECRTGLIPNRGHAAYVRELAVRLGLAPLDGG